MTAAQGGGEYLDRDRFQALVIGSGFGGAVAACRLAQAGVGVAVVERGRRWPPRSFPRDLSRLDAGWLWLCNHGLYDARPLNDILAVQAAGWGGGSLVYANVAVRPPQEVFDRSWPEPYSRAVLEPYYDLVAHMLEVRPVPADPRTGQLPPKTRLMAKAAGLLGQRDGFFHPNLAVRFEGEGPNRFGVAQKPCTFSGQCDIGCNEGAKNTLDLNYLALAERHGAAVATLTEAVHIARAGDGYRVRLREHGHPGAAREGVERDVTARYQHSTATAPIRSLRMQRLPIHRQRVYPNLIYFNEVRRRQHPTAGIRVPGPAPGRCAAPGDHGPSPWLAVSSHTTRTSRMIVCVDGDDLPMAGRAGERQPKELVPPTVGG